MTSHRESGSEQKVRGKRRPGKGRFPLVAQRWEKERRRYLPSSFLLRVKLSLSLSLSLSHLSFVHLVEGAAWA